MKPEQEHTYILPCRKADVEKLTAKVGLGYPGVLFTTLFLVLPFLSMRVKTWYWVAVAVVMSFWLLRVVMLHRKLAAWRKSSPELFKESKVNHLPLQTAPSNQSLIFEVQQKSGLGTFFLFLFTVAVATTLWITVFVNPPEGRIFTFFVYAIIIAVTAGIAVHFYTVIAYSRYKCKKKPQLIINASHMSIPCETMPYVGVALKFARAGHDPLVVPWSSIKSFVVEKISFGSESDLKVYTLSVEGSGVIHINREIIAFQNEALAIDFIRSKLTILVEQTDALIKKT